MNFISDKKTKYLSIFAFVALYLFGCRLSYAVHPGTYDHGRQSAYIAVYENMDSSFKSYSTKRVLLYVDFLNKNTIRIAYGDNLSQVSVNYDNSILSYNDSRGLHFVDAESRNTIWDVGVVSLGKYTWAADRNSVGMVDLVNNMIVELNVDDSVINAAPFKGVVWQVVWSKKHEDFLYLISMDDVSERKVVRLDGDEFKVEEDSLYLTISPDAKYYFVSAEEGDGANTFELFDNVTGESVVGPFFAQAAPKQVNMLWGIDTLRILGDMTLFDIKNKILLSSSYYYWSDDFPRDLVAPSSVDVAADRRRYVLKFNEHGGIFEVEDINTGDIVKRYDRFW